MDSYFWGRPGRNEARMGRPSKYPAEFRREVIALVKSSGRPEAEVVGSIEIAEGAAWNWVRLTVARLRGLVE